MVAGEAQILADNACGNRFVVGPATAADWRALDLSTHAVQAGDLAVSDYGELGRLQVRFAD